MKFETILQHSTQVMASELDGELVILDFATSAYYGLNQTGKFIWEQINGKRNIIEICNLLTEEYQLDNDSSIHEEVLTLLDSLVEKGLLNINLPDTVSSESS